jgi:hypothetical protein
MSCAVSPKKSSQATKNLHDSSAKQSEDILINRSLVAARTAAVENAARLQRVKRGSCRLSIFWSCAMIAPVK